MKEATAQVPWFLNDLVDMGLPCRVPLKGRINLGPPWHIGPRRLPDHLLYYVVSGGLEGTVGDTRFGVGPYQLLWIPPGFLHRLWINEALGPLGLFYFRLHVGQGRCRTLDPKGRFVYDFPSGEVQLLETLALLDRNTPWSHFRARCRLADFLGGACEHAVSSKAASQKLTSQQVYQLKSLILGAPQRRFTLKELARTVALNPDYFSRKFKATFGQTVQTFLKQERIQAACNLLLESHLSVAEVAHALGYDDPYFFSHQFKDVTGQRPGRWRKQNRGEALG